MLQTGSLVDGKYKILSKIGQGGMSVVYMAINERANKTWAIKEIRRDGVQDYEVVKQGLIVETDLLKKLNHPNLPSIIDVIEEQDSFLIVMDYIEGKPLSSTLREFGAQDQDQVIKWAKQLCDVLSYLHSREPAIIYRDMKPSNVMLKPDGNIMLIDFGIAREFKKNHVADTTCLGTRGYAAPEQYGGHGQTDARTDIYCLGATMYHLLTGHNPSEPPYEMYPIRYWNPGLSTGLEEIILKCTQANPDDRFQSCAELMYALNHYTELDHAYRKKQGRRWGAFIAMAVLTIAAGAGAVGFKIAENNAMQAGYEQSIISAEASQDQEEMFGYYMQAINLRPMDEAPYLAVLSSFLNDGVFSAEEEKQFRTMIGNTSDTQRTNLDYLKTNEFGYHRLCKEAAMAYFYYMEDGGTKTGARQWLNEIQNITDLSDEDPLSESDVERAKLLYKITEYYASLGVTDRAGDSKASYKDYWYDLVAATSGDLVALDNAMTTLVVYKEIAGQISTLCDKFKKAGIGKDELVSRLDEIDDRLENNVKPAIEKEENPETQSSMLEISANIKTIMESARKNVELVYSDTSAISVESDVGALQPADLSADGEPEPSDGEGR